MQTNVSGLVFVRDRKIISQVASLVLFTVQISKL